MEKVLPALLLLIVMASPENLFGAESDCNISELIANRCESRTDCAARSMGHLISFRSFDTYYKGQPRSEAAKNALVELFRNEEYARLYSKNKQGNYGANRIDYLRFSVENDILFERLQTFTVTMPNSPLPLSKVASRLLAGGTFGARTHQPLETGLYLLSFSSKRFGSHARNLMVFKVSGETKFAFVDFQIPEKFRFSDLPDIFSEMSYIKRRDLDVVFDESSRKISYRLGRGDKEDHMVDTGFVLESDEVRSIDPHESVQASDDIDRVIEACRLAGRRCFPSPT